MLKNIQTIKCPICGCMEIVKEYVETTCFSEPKVRQHCNGTRWEYREFLCGYKVQYVPNYSRELVSEKSECFYDPKVIVRKEKEKQDKEQLVKILEENSISQVLIDRIKLHCLW
ncbi:hypothetical protein DVV91_10215 [Clostridium botulinum]|uniref:hypothetical protein n=1 Tax=Clostridium botulinum TaxID=1491 RepID=UPI001966FCDA|nr:hypothetical protein [Clostridium botulinum]MBN1074716.1 hypothetical protein [Clostridium botulinum]